MAWKDKFRPLYHGVNPESVECLAQALHFLYFLSWVKFAGLKLAWFAPIC